jgi:tRNA nucleotidyltransferase/poly(A) polymerase
MSDYIYMLESRLSAGQNRVVKEVENAAAQAGSNVFLAGGAMRDMLGGSPIRDLDFSVEGQALKLAKTVAERAEGRMVSADEHRRTAELLFPGGVTVQIAMSRTERYTKTGVRPQVTPASIQEDLRGRDFSINAIALSLNRASRGLLLDPTNGLADLERREMRSLSTYTFFDDPSRLLRLVRFRVRLGFTVEERTAQQMRNAREAGVLGSVTADAFLEELRRVATEPCCAGIMKALDEEGLLDALAPRIAGGKLNAAGLTRLEKAVHLLPDDGGSHLERVGPFFTVLLEKLPSRERQAFAKEVGLRKTEIESWQKLDARARKLETVMKSPRLKKPSQVYFAVVGAPPGEVLLLLARSPVRMVQDRMHHYFEKYLPLAREIGPEQLTALEAKPGTPKWEKAREALLAAHLDRRPKKPVIEPPPEPPPLMIPGRGRPRSQALLAHPR